MKKNLKITSLTAAALAALILSSANLNNNVKADDVTSKVTTSEKSQSPEDQAKANVSSAQHDVDTAQKDVDSSKKDLDKAKSDAVGPNKAYDDQAAKTKEANENAANKKNALDDANKKQSDAQKLADEATPDAINKARQDVVDKNSEIAQKQQAVRDAQAKTSDAQKNVDDANADVNAKNSALTKANNDKANADAQVKNAQDALNGTGITEAKKALDDANTSVKNDEDAISNINKDIATKTADKNAKADAKSNAEEASQNAEQDKQNAQQDYDSKKNISDEANAAVKAKQKEIDDVNNKLNALNELSKNTINIGDKDAFLKAIIDYAVDNSLSDEDIASVNRARAMNKFIHSEADKHEQVDLNNLTDDQLKEISLFTSDILSKVRSQLGLNVANDQVTKGAMDVTRKIAQRYQDDFKAGKWHSGWHDSYGINEIASQNGLEPLMVKDEKTNVEHLDTLNQPLEDMSGTYKLNREATMDELKGEIYQGLLDMILPSGNGITHRGQTTPTYEMGHTFGLLGIDSNSLNPTRLRNHRKWAADAIKDGYRGVTLTINDHEYKGEEIESYINDIDNKLQQLTNKTYHLQKDDVEDVQYVAVIPTYFGGDTDTKLHFINISPSQIKNDSEKSKEYKDSTDTPSYKNQVEESTNKQESLSSEIENLNASAQEKQNQANEAENTLKQKEEIAKNKLNELDEANNNYQAAVNALQQAIEHEQQLQAAYEQHQAVQQNAQARYNTLTASNEEKTHNLENAVQAQTAAEQNVKNAAKALSDAKNVLANAKQAQANLKTDIANKQGLVEKAQGELAGLQARQTLLEGAHQALENAKQATQQAQNEYNAAKQVADAAETQLNTLKNAKDTADAKVKDAQDKYDQAEAKLGEAKSKLNHAKQVLYDLEHPAIYVDDTSEVQKPQNLQKVAETTTNEGEKTTPIIKKSTSVKIEFVRNAYVYTIKGKIVKRHGKRYLIRKGHKAVALNNAKIVKINGKKFYQIAKNEYVKVVNTMTKARKANVKVIVKGRKNQKVRTYSSTGKFTHHYVYGKRSYKFTSKKNIKGKTYYKLSGKNEWVLASKLIWKN